MLDFGKNAIYIWGCYGISAIVLGGLVISALRSPKQ